MHTYQIIGLAISIVFFFVLLLLVRSKKLRESYIWLWLLLDLLFFLTVLGLPWLSSVAQLLGFELVSNLLLVLAIFTIVVVIIHITIVITSLEKSNLRLKQEVALLKFEIEKLSDKAENGN